MAAGWFWNQHGIGAKAVATISHMGPGFDIPVCPLPQTPRQIMETPLPQQVRAPQPEAEAADDADCMELIEMVLGALGRDALGLGSSMAHPAQSEEWRAMSIEVGWRPYF